MKHEIPNRPDEIMKQCGRTSLASGLYYYFHYLFGYGRTRYQIHFPSECTRPITLLIIVKNLLIFENRWKEILTKTMKKQRPNVKTKELIDPIKYFLTLLNYIISIII